MPHQFVSSLRRLALLSLPALLLAGCDRNPTEVERPSGAEAAVVINSRERSLTVIPVENPSAAFTIGVSPEGTPVTVAARGAVAVVPLGTYPFAAVVDLQTRAVRHTVALPEGSGATGVAFLNDSIALVANPRLNTVTPVNVVRGTTGAQIAVGGYPSKIVAANGRAYVLNAELERFVPVRPGTISVIDGSLSVVGTIQLAGLNPGGAAFGKDGRLYVVNSGRFRANNGSLSVVDVTGRREVSHHEGFGNFPGSIAVARDGRVFTGLYGTGILVWDPSTRTFTRGLDNPLKPGQVPPVSAVDFDSEGRLYVLTPGTCREAGSAYRATAEGQVEWEAPTGICPFGLAFARLPVP